MADLIVDQNNNSFPKFEAGKLVYIGNFFNPNANNNRGVGYSWNIPLSDESNRCDAEVTGPCVISFTGVGNNNNAPFGYPSAVLGSLGGRFETQGVDCGDVRILGGMRDVGVSPSPVYDLNVPSKNTGLPAMIGELPSIDAHVGSRVITAKRPNANWFFDAYWYDTKQNPPLPQYSDSVNGINATRNRMWNTNVWYGHPNQDAMWEARMSGNSALENMLITQYTGGDVVGIVVIDENIYKIVFKYEDGGDNNFFYVGFVLVTQDGGKPNPDEFVLRYDGIKDYMLSDSFWRLATESAEGQEIIARMANPVGNRLPIVVTRPNVNMYMDMIAVGNEYWGNDDDDTTAVEWNTLAFVVDGERIGTKGELFAAKDAGCLLPINYLGPEVKGCILPINYKGNFNCRLPINYSVGIPKLEVDCLNCPSYQGNTPKLLAPYGSSGISLSLATLVDFPEGAASLITDVRSTGLSGSLVTDTRRGTISYVPRNNFCDVECGKLEISFAYRCPTITSREVTVFFQGTTIPLFTETSTEIIPITELVLQDGSVVAVQDPETINVLQNPNDPPIGATSTTTTEKRPVDDGIARLEDIEAKVASGLFAQAGEPAIGAANVVITGGPREPTFEEVPRQQVIDDNAEDSGIILENPDTPASNFEFETLYCSLQIQICSFPDAIPLPDECINLPAGTTEFLIPVVDAQTSGEDICEAVVKGYCGSVEWQGDGYLFKIPKGAFGCWDVIVPSYPVGDKAHATMRCVTIKVAGGKGVELPECCQTVLMVRDDCDDTWRPVGKMSDFNLNVTEIRPDDFINFETCETEVHDAERHEWTFNGVRTFLLDEGNSIQSGKDYDVRIVFDIFNPDRAYFTGRARATNFNLSTQASQDPNEKKNNITLTGHGSFCAVGFKL